MCVCKDRIVKTDNCDLNYVATCNGKDSCICTPVTEDCFKNSFKSAFVLLAKNEDELTKDRIEKLKTIKKSYPNYFYDATRNLATDDTNYPVITIIDDGTIIDTDRDYFDMTKLAEKLYETEPDIFDFINVFTAYDTNQSMGHFRVYTSIKGISDSTRNLRSRFGNSDHLLGTSFIGPIDEKDPFDWRTYSGILHETGHQWCCHVGDDFSGGENEAQLEITLQGIHFYPGLESPYDNRTAMGSQYWVPNDDGTYHREYKWEAPKYHNFVLYFMGLLPPPEYSTLYNIYNATIPVTNFETATFYKSVSVDDIISVEGPRLCEHCESLICYY